MAEEMLIAHAPEDTPTPRQLLILDTLTSGEAMNQTNIVAMTGVDRSTVAEIVTRLARNGWVTRRRCRLDARAQAIRITDKGRAALSAAERSLKLAEAQVLALVSAQYQPHFLAALHEIRQATIGSRGRIEAVAGEAHVQAL